MIRRCTDDDVTVMDEIINEAAVAYRGVIPADCWHEPYMKRSELLSEIAAGVEFWGWEDGALVGVMGLQKVRDVTLIRHAYVRPFHQGKGVGGALLTELSNQIKPPDRCSLEPGPPRSGPSASTSATASASSTATRRIGCSAPTGTFHRVSGKRPSS